MNVSTSAINLPITESSQLVDLFHAVFFEKYHVRLQGGANEPLYLPVRASLNNNLEGSNLKGLESAVIYFRSNYLSSALHEISHWTIAGESRRRLEDYGYWYEADDRDQNLQMHFESVEVKPQAIELLLHLASGLTFKVSVDNLSLPDYDSAPFAKKVAEQARAYCCHNMDFVIPARAQMFIEALLSFRGYQFSHIDELKEWLSREIKKKAFINL